MLGHGHGIAAIFDFGPGLGTCLPLGLSRLERMTGIEPALSAWEDIRGELQGLARALLTDQEQPIVTRVVCRVEPTWGPGRATHYERFQSLMRAADCSS